jgi:hypothetical protein
MANLSKHQQVAVPPAWEGRFQNLWAIGKNFAASIKTSPPPDDNEKMDDHTLAVFRMLAHFKDRILPPEDQPRGSHDETVPATPTKKNILRDDQGSLSSRKKPRQSGSSDKDYHESDHRDDWGSSRRSRRSSAILSPKRGEEQTGTKTVQIRTSPGGGSPGDDSSSSSSKGSGRDGRDEDQREDNRPDPAPRELDEDDTGSDTRHQP